MEIASFVLACGLLAQVPAAQQPAEPPAAQPGATSGEPNRISTEGPLVPVESRRDPRGAAKAAAEDPAAIDRAAPGREAPDHDAAAHDGSARTVPEQSPESPPRRLRASDILIGALTIPQDAPLSGRPVMLVEVLSSSVDRAAQLQATEAYWKLTAAVAEFNFCQDELDQLLRLKPATAPGQEDAAAQKSRWLEPRLADAKARLHEAQSSLVAAQFDLAQRMRLPASQPLPLPADMPHVGPYRTRLADVYAHRPPPSQALLFDRTLPVRYEAIDLRAAAVQAALDAVDSLEEAYNVGKADLPTVMASVDHLARQRRAFILGVHEYNDAIAAYALGVPASGLTSQALASMLIKPRVELRAPTMTAGGGIAPSSGGLPADGVERAGFNQEMPAAGPPAESRPATPPNRIGEPTPAPPRKQGEPTLAPPQGTGQNDAASPAAGVDKPPEARTAQKPDAAAADAAANSPGIVAQPDPPDAAHLPPRGLYPALVGLAPAQQAQHLAEVLHLDCEMPAPPSMAATLLQCLATTPGPQRRALIDVYWSVREQTARYHVLTREVEQLDEIAALLLNASGDPGAAEAMLRLQSARRAAAADAADAHVGALVRQFALTEIAGRPVSVEWLLPATAPHAGGYELKLDLQPQAARDSTTVRRAAASIPLVQAALAERATGVIAADTACAGALVQMEAGRPAAVTSISAIRDQADQTLAFLAALSEYNRLIADYVTSVLPPETPGETLCRALVKGG
jgi:hypothetical protein